MDISPAGPGIQPWLVLALVLAVVAAGGGALLVLRRRTARRRTASAGAAGPAGPHPGYGEDDLPGFLESPPGSAAQPAAPSSGWPALAPHTGAATSPAPPGQAAPSAGSGRRRTVVLAVLALTTVLIVAAVLAFPSRPGPPGHDRTGGEDPRGTVVLPLPPLAPEPGQPGAGALADASVRDGRDGGAARLAFGGLVLEQRAVGITATYPTVDGTWTESGGVAHVRLPTFNCLADSAPEDPVAAGCLASGTEYADLPTPALEVTGDDGTVRLSGRFPTYLRPNGSPPVWTGRVYELSVRAAPADDDPAEGWVRAEGEIRLGAGRAPTLDTPDVTVLRRG